MRVLSGCLSVGLILGWGLIGCSSEPKDESPVWTKQPTRVVDNGYIVYVGTAEAGVAERATFKAEGQALEDLANECSMIPRGARIEDRYQKIEKKQFKAYVKVAIEFQECDQAQRTVDPEAIRRLASVGFTEQLRRYQELNETGQLPDRSEVAQVVPPETTPPPPARQVAWNDSTQFYVMRQYVAYQKQVVVLAPPNSYPPNSPAAQSFVTQVGPQTEVIHNIGMQNPTLTKQPWSQVPQRPVIARPAALSTQNFSHPTPQVHPQAAPAHPYRGQANRGGGRSSQPARRRQAQKRRRN